MRHLACITALLQVLALSAFLSIPRTATAQIEERTHAELSDFAEFTPYESMLGYLGRIQASSTEMRMGSFGETHQGRSLPFAIFSRPSLTRPWEAWSLGKPILVLAANVHGGERTLRESVLILTRELATPGTRMNEALDDLTILVVPQLNPDGFSADPRPRRGNRWDLDLNRDYMKLEQPETRAYVENILLSWAPHLFVDGHNGGSDPYNINYQCPSHAAPDPRLTELCDESLFPAIDRALDSEGYRSWYYTRGTRTRWNVGGPDPRIGRNYGGFANMVGVLFESPGGQGTADGVRSGVLAYETVIEWARQNSELLLETVRRARLETIELGDEPRGDVPIEVEYAPEEYPVEYLIEEGTDGATLLVQSDSLMKRPVATLVRPRPWAYLIPRDAEDAVELVRSHGVQVEVLREPITVPVDAYRIAGISYEEAYNHGAAVRLEVLDTVRREMSLPEGTYLVRMGQMQGRVAAHLLEPETRDGVVYWNRMDAWLPKDALEVYQAGEGDAPLFPVVKLMEPIPLPTRLLP